jgi:hypothetical protein
MTYWPDPNSWVYVPTSIPQAPYLDGNDWAAFDRFAARVRGMSDGDLADQFGIRSAATVALLRELAAS